MIRNPATLVVSVVYVVLAGQFKQGTVALELARPVFNAPEFTLAALVSLALPLFVVTMASQNLPGVAAISAAGYPMPISRIITLTGVATLILAPFGAFALNLSAITAAICMGEDAHREAALIAFLVTLSGLTLWGVGSAFWGVVADAIAPLVQQYRFQK